MIDSSASATGTLPADPWRTGAMIVCAVATVVASFLFLSDLGRATGWPGPTAYLLPLTVDALAVAAWRAGHRGVGLFATAVSVAGNAAGHALATGRLDPGVAITGGWPVVALALIVHLSRPAAAAPPIAPLVIPALVEPVTPRPTAPAAATATPIPPTPRPGPAASVLASPASVIAASSQASRPAPAGAPDVAAMTDEQLVAYATAQGKTSYRDLWKLGVRPDSRARAINTLIRNGAPAC